MRKSLKIALCGLLAPALLLAGCADPNTTSNSNSSSSATTSSQVMSSSSSAASSNSASSSSAPAADLGQMDATLYPSQARADNAIAPIRNQVGSLQWNGHGAYIVNDNQPNLGAVKPYGRPWAQSHPDSQGRAAIGDAYLTKQARQYRNRSETGNGASAWKPAGYMQQSNLPGRYRFAYNRGHLLGYALVGNIRGFDASESNSQNIATQTMWANQAQDATNTGQNYYEGLVRQALDQNKYVRYQVKDLYSSNEKVPRAAEIQARSSDGSVSFHVLIPNAQNNMVIDYQNGNVTPCSGGRTNTGYNTSRAIRSGLHLMRHHRF